MAESDRIGEILYKLGNVEGLLEGIQNEQERIAHYVQATSGRVGALERNESRSKGWAAGAGAVAGAVITGVLAVLKHVWP